MSFSSFNGPYLLPTSPKTTLSLKQTNRLHCDEEPIPSHTVRQGEEEIGTQLFRISIHLTALVKSKPHLRSSTPLLKIPARGSMFKAQDSPPPAAELTVSEEGSQRSSWPGTQKEAWRPRQMWDWQMERNGCYGCIRIRKLGARIACLFRKQCPKHRPLVIREKCHII